MGRHGLSRQSDGALQHLRCTLDTFEDYLQIEQAFRGLENPVTVSLGELVTSLANNAQPDTTQALPTKLVLGTAQLGLDYGVTNENGRPNDAESTAIVQAAIGGGIRCLDTARAYGDSEAVIGRALDANPSGTTKVYTKLGLLTDCPEDAGPEVVATFVDSSILSSCVKLGVKSLDGLLVHRAEHLRAWGGAAWEHLKKLKARGSIDVLGVSVQSPEELRSVLVDNEVRHIQLPYNLLDHRWDEAESAIQAARKTRDVTVHARSALMQGLLATGDTDLWQRANCLDPSEAVSWLERSATRYGRKNVVDLCLAYVRSQSWIDGVVVGAETLQQVHELLDYFHQPMLFPDDLQDLRANRPVMKPETLDPSKWKKA